MLPAAPDTFDSILVELRAAQMALARVATTIESTAMQGTAEPTPAWLKPADYMAKYGLRSRRTLENYIRLGKVQVRRLPGRHVAHRRIVDMPPTLEAVS